MPTFQFDGKDTYTMPLDMLERKYYPISSCNTPLGDTQYTFDQLVERMMKNPSSNTSPSPCPDGVLPPHFIVKDVSQGSRTMASDVIWKVPSYSFDGFSIKFDVTEEPKFFSNFYSDVKRTLVEFREKQLEPLPLPPQEPPKERTDSGGGTRRRRRTRRR